MVLKVVTNQLPYCIIFLATQKEHKNIDFHAGTSKTFDGQKPSFPGAEFDFASL